MSTLSAAADHLRMLRLERDPKQDALYVRLAFTYGIPVDEIASISDLPLQRVRAILDPNSCARG